MPSFRLCMCNLDFDCLCAFGLLESQRITKKELQRKDRTIGKLSSLVSSLRDGTFSAKPDPAAPLAGIGLEQVERHHRQPRVAHPVAGIEEEQQSEQAAANSMPAAAAGVAPTSTAPTPVGPVRAVTFDPSTPAATPSAALKTATT